MATDWTIRLVAMGKLLYSGHEDENPAHTEGVTIMLSRTAQKTDWMGSARSKDYNSNLHYQEEHQD
jgi:hypothetical protein